MSKYDFDPEEIQATILQDNYAEAIIACEVERRLAKTYQAMALSIIGGAIALSFFSGAVILVNNTKTADNPTIINIKQPQ